MTSRFIIFLFILFSIDSFSQGLMEDKLKPTRQDSLRGSITPEREWWDLTYYHLDIKVEPDKKYISGSNTVGYKVLKSNKTMQIDLQEPMKITSVTSNGKKLKFNREGNAYFIQLRNKQKKNDINLSGTKCNNWLGVPLKLTNGKTIGMIGIQSYDQDVNFNEEDKKILHFVSDQIAMAIKRKIDDIQIHKQAHYDQLTGLTNKALFHDRLDQAIHTAERKDEVLAVLFIDLDKYVLNLELSKAPPIPITLFFETPVAFNVK